MQKNSGLNQQIFESSVFYTTAWNMNHNPASKIESGFPSTHLSNQRFYYFMAEDDPFYFLVEI